MRWRIATHDPMPKKAIVIGLDCLQPKLTLKFVEEGILPNIESLMRRGIFTKALPCFPAWTPTNWTTIATGAYPGTHGVFLWGTHVPGEPLERDYRQLAMSSTICTAEYIWEAAARDDLKTVLFYFVGYPRTTHNAIHFDWLLSPGSYFFELAKSACYTTLDINGTPLDLQPASGWKNIAEGEGPEPLEAEIEVTPKSEGRGPVYHLCLVGSNGSYSAIHVSKEKDGSDSVLLRPGEWTDWMIEEFALDQGPVLGSVRFKLVELSEDGRAVRLYRSQVYPLEGFSAPAEFAGELVKRLGPYVNEDVAHAYAKGWVDWETVEEELSQQIEWIGRASRHLMNETGATLYFTHWHLLDSIHHHSLGGIDPAGGRYDPKEAAKAWDETRRAYVLADKLVGELARIADDETVTLVVSDHGNTPNRKRVSLINLFLEKGWMATCENEDGETIIDERRSKLALNSLHIYVNLRGREPNGIVPPEEYDGFREEVLDALRNLRDPEDGEPALQLALRKEDAGVMGMWGEGIGDIVLVYAPGHAWTGGEVLKMGEKRVIFPSGGANHGPQPPWTETEVSSNYATLVMAGPGLQRNRIRGDHEPLVSLVDVAPTIARLTGIQPPANAQGRVLTEFMEEAPPAVSRPPKSDFLVPEIPTSKGPPKFKGDVTDEL
jgi:predicted AlkP superfamily phosphohydrolase/phosphomutase